MSQAWKRNSPKKIPRDYWEYILGILHGDGYIQKNSLKIAIGYNAVKYLQNLKYIFENKFGLRVKIYNNSSCFHLVVNSKILVETFIPLKKNSLWKIPNLQFPERYLSGLIDTDGSVPIVKKHNLSKAVTISQKSNGNLKLIIPLLNNLKIRYSFIENYKYINKLGMFKMDTIYIRGKESIIRLNSIVKLLNPKKRDRLKQMKIVYNETPYKRPNGILGNLIINCIKKGINNSLKIRKFFEIKKFFDTNVFELF